MNSPPFPQPPSFPRRRESRWVGHAPFAKRRGRGSEATAGDARPAPVIPAKSGEIRRFSGRNVHPEGPGAAEIPERQRAHIPFAKRRGRKRAKRLSHGMLETGQCATPHNALRSLLKRDARCTERLSRIAINRRWFRFSCGGFRLTQVSTLLALRRRVLPPHSARVDELLQNHDQAIPYVGL